MYESGAVRASRLLTILLTLQTEGRTTAHALATRLEVSRRTVLRDVDELVASGVPIYAERGREGGFALLDGFRTELTGLTADETEALILAGVPAAAADLGFATAASGARLKMLAALPARARRDAQRIAERFHVDPVDWYQRPRVAPHLRTVADATWRARRLRVDYASWRGRRSITIAPLGLVLKAGRWYVLALGTAAERIYRLDSMLDVAALDETFERPARFDLAAAWRTNVERFETGLRSGTARLRAAPSSLDRLDRLGADIAEPLRAAAPDRAGRRTAVVPIESVAHAAGLLLGFADEIEVVEPPELRRELRDRARRVVALYAGARPSRRPRARRT